MFRIISSSDRAVLNRLFAKRRQRLGQAESTVAPIIEAVRERGDGALLAHARRYDGLKGNTVRIPPEQFRDALHQTSEDFRDALETAAQRIRQYAELQMPQPWWKRVQRGIKLGQIVRPIGSVGAYIPGGSYPLPSTLMMTVVPAQVAGVEVISVASPKPTPATLAAAGFLRVENFFHMGGAQAIAAFAFGTDTVPRADRIVGPGNIYVAAAKRLLAGEVGIDFVAGPTEIMLIAPKGAGAREFTLLAADMLAQAEHDVDATALLLTHSKRTAIGVQKEVKRQLKALPTRAIAATSLGRNGAIILTRSLDEAIEIANRFAPEHLSIPDDSFLKKVTNAGSVFVGSWSPEAAGDYASGPNHVLPTGGVATFRGGLSVLDYVKIISVQQLDRAALKRLAPAITTLARAEGLEGHARSIEVRVDE